MFEKSKIASRELGLLPAETIDAVLLALADAAIEREAEILEANARDLSKINESNPLYDRLLLNSERIAAISSDIRNVAGLNSPLGECLSEAVRPNGMKIRKVRVPFGLIGVIYEARPNVSFDVFSLCFKTANAVILKGSRDAEFSNITIVNIIKDVLDSFGINRDVVTLLDADRSATTELLNAVGYVDLIIPRGSSALIKYVRSESKVPVIETGAGICHTYVDKNADIVKASRIVFNSKTRRVSVCNALDCMIIHKDILSSIYLICKDLESKNVKIYADEPSYSYLNGHYNSDLLFPADENSFGTEFLDYAMSIKTANNIDEAVQHIGLYSSKHSECIVSENVEALAYFTARIDAACVYENVSTAFTDGAQFGFGAEIGISTQKLHARGPMALPELTSYKYIISGRGQIR